VAQGQAALSRSIPAAGREAAAALALPVAVATFALASCGPGAAGAGFQAAQDYADPASAALVAAPPPVGTAWSSPPPGPPFRAGTVSHHLLAAGAIDRFFAELAARQAVRTFVIVTPGHYRQGFEPVAVSALPWRTSSGSVRIDARVLGGLEKAGAVRDEGTFRGEHGIGALVPFVEKHFPGARIVPMALETESRRFDAIFPLAEALARIMARDDGIFLLLSTDFSHHEGLERTLERDARSLAALATFDEASQWRVYSDNPGGFLLLAKTFRMLGGAETFVAARTDGHELAGATEDLTSYIFCYLRPHSPDSGRLP